MNLEVVEFQKSNKTSSLGIYRSRNAKAVGLFRNDGNELDAPNLVLGNESQSEGVFGRIDGLNKRF